MNRVRICDENARPLSLRAIYSASMVDKIFVNLPVKDLEKTMAFWKKLGFSFNPQFTDEKAACLVIGENIFAMLLLEKYFVGFNPGKGIADSKKSTEVLTALHLQSRAKVDEMVKKAVAAGGAVYRDPDIHGDWMYAHSFEDLDGHRWEVFYMDESKMPANPS